MTSSSLLSRPGAVALEEGGAVAAHYGDPLREQRARSRRWPTIFRAIAQIAFPLRVPMEACS